MTRKHKTTSQFNAHISKASDGRKDQISSLALDNPNESDLSSLQVGPSNLFHSRGEVLGKLFSSIKVCIAYLDADGNFLRVNEAFAHAFGQEPEFFTGKNTFDLTPNSDGRDLFTRVLHTRMPFSAYDIPYQDPAHPERTTYWDWTLQPIVEPDDRVSGIIFTSIDVTERRRAEKALEESQALFELLFESAPDANILTDEEDRILALNQRAEKIFGYQRGTLIGKKIDFLIPDEGGASPTDISEARPSFERMAYRLDGYAFPVSITLNPLKTENRTLILRVVRDVSQQKQSEQSLRASEARFHAIFDKASLGIQLLEASGNILETNPAMQVMLGYSADELRGMNFLKFTYQQDVPKNLSLYEALLCGDIASYQLEKRYVRKDGSLFWGRQNVSRYGEEPGQPPYVIVMVEDINQLRETGQALQASEERFRTSLETLLDGFAILSAVRDQNGKIVDFTYEYINEAGCRLNRLPRAQHLGHSMQEVPSIHQEAGLKERYAQVVESGQALAMESLLYEDSDGGDERVRRGYDVKAFKLGDGIAVAWQDITPRKQAEDALRRQEALLRNVIESLPVGVWITDRKGQILFGNEAGRRIWGGIRQVTPDQYDQYRGFWPVTGKQIQGEEWAIWRALKQGQTVIEEEVIIEAFDGLRKTILNSAVPIWDENHEVSGAILVNQDISERKQMQTELAEVQRKLLDKAEEERLRLARDLHDGPIQDLYGMSFQLNELREQVVGDEAKDLVNKAGYHLQSTIISLRAIMTALRPPTLTPFGLEKTIQSHAETFQQLHPEIRLHLELMRDGQKLPEAARLVLFRIYQESLNNILRHAQARNITVRFHFDEQQAQLTVTDDGIGFKVPHHWVELPRQGHYGLVGMRERAEALGGRFEVVSRSGKGTSFIVEIPLAKK